MQSAIPIVNVLNSLIFQNGSKLGPGAINYIGALIGRNISGRIPTYFSELKDDDKDAFYEAIAIINHDGTGAFEYLASVEIVDKKAVFGHKFWNKEEMALKRRLQNALMKPKVKGFLKCLKCGSDNTTTNMTQMSAGDEGMHAIIDCLECGSHREYRP